MIEELCEFLVRHGMKSELADDVHDEYAARGTEAAAQCAAELRKRKVRRLIERWQKEVGEVRR